MYGNRELKETKVKTVERTLKLLEALAEQSAPVSLTRAGQLSKLSVSTAYRLLNALCRSGFVERDRQTGHYKLGLKAFLIGNAALQNVELRPAARPFLNKLSESCHESAYLAILSGHDVIYADVAKTSSPFQVGIDTGVPVPACQTIAGQVLLAYQSPTEQARLAEIYLADRLIAAIPAFLADLQSVAKNGFACGPSGPEASIGELSYPVFNHQKICVASISIFQPVASMEKCDSNFHLAAPMRQTALDISRSLGAAV
jgi:IclR family acetate operon transcriptional repressor